MSGLGFLSTLMIKHYSIKQPEHNYQNKSVVVNVPEENGMEVKYEGKTNA